ncbi:polysaccharide deacetylase family protein [Marinigracilibium pacificum]|uniref:Polysaccharide deacetylase family protein n=1 Tax=Marinigracilibium pacificum TaxID=2729599 RepID=A0A848ITY9_9BACT|nr:polysaccharide deacetylase family protein [Marinigracilibium pacificum]NMM47807.1 polysaccharide deacetylase family protein [Marinigracilibium pacificum]
MNLRLLRTVIILFISCYSITITAQQSISFTFDDGNTANILNYSLEEWNSLILNSLEEENIKAAFFVKTENKNTLEGKYLLDSWNNAGHLIANHTYSHPNFNNPKISAENFRRELLMADSLINSYSNYTKLFRFPYLKEGNSQSKIDSIRNILKEYGYSNGYVTIDASDWYIDSRLRKRLKEDPNADISKFKQYYLDHIYNRALYYDSIGVVLTGRNIKHTLLLHHNLASALFLDDLIQMFKSKGWNIISAEEAFQDPIFKNIPEHAGESLIWAMAKDSGKFENDLRYPAEDSRYEKDKMDALGL